MCEGKRKEANFINDEKTSGLVGMKFWLVYNGKPLIQKEFGM